MRAPIGKAVVALTLSAACTAIRGPNPVAATRQYYEGTSTATLPTGRSVPNGVILARRTLDPEAGTIVEQVVSNDGRRPAAEYVIEMQVRGGAFTMRGADGSPLGEGTLDGKAWRWMVWRSTSRLPGGIRVESVDTLLTSALVVHKTIFRSDGALMLTTTERLLPIDAARFSQRRAEILRPPGGGP